MALVYGFDHHHAEAPMAMKALLGGKGANLAEMTSVLGLPVPPGFTITTEACRAYMDSGWPEGLTEEIDSHVSALESVMGRRLGDGADPLLVSVRSGAASSMPGMMDTVLNLGLNDQSVQGLAASVSDRRFAYDSYRRFVSMYGRIVLGVDGAELDRLLDHARVATGVSDDAHIPAEDLVDLCDACKEAVAAHTGSAFPQDPRAQLRGAIEAVFESWNGGRAVAYRRREHLDDRMGTAVNVQAMVFGNRNDNSGTGVGFTRDPATGAQGEYGDFLVNAQGEDVVAGIRTVLPLAALGDRFPAVFEELMGTFARLEEHYRDMCDTEFTIDDGKLWMLQTRVGKRTGRAAFRMAVDMVRQSSVGQSPGWSITEEEAVARVTADHVDQLLHPQFAERPSQLLTKGLPASPGAAVGAVCLTSADAVAAARRGEAVILVRSETSPDDVAGMIAAQGILTSRGGLVSHAAVVARGWGKPAIVGADAMRIAGGGFNVGETRVEAGEVISIDGATGEVALGEVALTAADPTPELDTVLGWADDIRAGIMAVRTNADTGDDATVARRLGAEGIGLCRTEHMFLAEDRLPIVRRMIVGATLGTGSAALEELREAQRRDFGPILEAMDGLPVTVRLLDPPLHEFLPKVNELLAEEVADGLDDLGRLLLDVARQWQEINPMIGTRGVRLGVVLPGLYAMQVRALVEAALDRVAAGGDPRVEIMVPLTVSRAELALARSWVDDAVAGVLAGSGRALEVSVGTMVETPRAAIVAGEIAEVADFFSFGTNDLTQMTFGFSRDDVAPKLIPAYLEQGLLGRDPFETIDTDGVGHLVAAAATAGRATRPGLKVGVCGEHGGDPESISFFHRVGIDYVSCSPYRVPIARLAAAQAVLASR